MKKTVSARHILLITGLFIASRVIVRLCGVQMEYNALARYWQYLDIDTLKSDLLNGVFYDHTQPPIFNLLLGTVLKLAGAHSETAFVWMLKSITLANTFLLYALTKRMTLHKQLPLVFSLIYLLSPATLIFENELFYTTFITLCLLIASLFMLRLQLAITVKNVACFLIPLVIICLTRSMYHLLWLTVVMALVIFYLRKNEGVRTLVWGALIALVVTGSWYAKNKIIFDTFSTSSWIGMNMARNVFHDASAIDSSRIESIEPFSQISVYAAFLSQDYAKYRGLNDRDLMMEMKNDSFTNTKHIAYLEISDKYLNASKAAIKAHPSSYLKNVLQSAIIFFAPGTRYPTTEHQVAHIKYYDILYSFNLTHFAHGKQQRRIALVISAFPKILIYLFVFGWLLARCLRTRRLQLIHAFTALVIGYIFFISSFFEHYENMRFRFEAEPLFLLLAAVVTDYYLVNRHSKKV
ncbi:MAG: hypothetical protein H7Y03_03050 [Chitinophagaceae bacterium]|nr:hypothetical protein [Chitinophagaceae bacterium]